MLKHLFFLFISSSAFLFSHTQFLKENIYNLPKIHKIPKIIHQIWVGKNKMPPMYKEYIKTWKIVHPDWEYRLWTDEDVEDFPWINKDLFLNAENPGMKSDIWRYEIINLHGGLYIDTDMECFRSFDPIQERLEFYAGICDNKLIACGIFASKPNSPVLESVIANLGESISSYNFDTFNADDIMFSTGPMYFTNIINEILPSLTPSLNIVFEQEYFQPVECCHRGVPVTNVEVDNIRNICFAIDHNGCSWVPEGYD